MPTWLLGKPVNLCIQTFDLHALERSQGAIASKTGFGCCIYVPGGEDQHAISRYTNSAIDKITIYNSQKGYRNTIYKQ